VEDRGRNFPAFILVDDKGNDFFANDAAHAFRRPLPSKVKT